MYQNFGNLAVTYDLNSYDMKLSKGVFGPKSLYAIRKSIQA